MEPTNFKPFVISPNSNTQVTSRIQPERQILDYAVIQQKDAFFKYKESITPTEKGYIKLYKKLWHETNLPSKLRPKLIFENTDRKGRVFGLNPIKNTIFVPSDNNVLKTYQWLGVDKELLRHEIAHSEQLYKMLRVLGPEKFRKMIFSDRNEYMKGIYDKKSYNMAYKIMGKLDPTSKEGQKALKFVEAYKKYTSISSELIKVQEAGFFKKFPAYVNYLTANKKYKNNFLEIGAKNTAKKYHVSNSQQCSKILKFIWTNLSKKR